VVLLRSTGVCSSGRGRTRFLLVRVQRLFCSGLLLLLQFRQLRLLAAGRPWDGHSVLWAAHTHVGAQDYERAD
jgi:hypothetical protein